jgi:hypothetical protein
MSPVSPTLPSAIRAQQTAKTAEPQLTALGSEPRSPSRVAVETIQRSLTVNHDLHQLIAETSWMQVEMLSVKRWPVGVKVGADWTQGRRGTIRTIVAEEVRLFEHTNILSLSAGAAAAAQVQRLQVIHHLLWSRQASDNSCHGINIRSVAEY